MATSSSGGGSKNGRSSIGRRLGLKKSGGQSVISGQIIIRQRGTKYYAGKNVGMGKDHTLYAKVIGIVCFKKGYKQRTYVAVNTKI